MSKPLRFTIFKMQRGGKILYRIRIPARFAASGKKTDLYYKTRAEAEEEQALLREKFANGELTLGTILGPGQVKDAQQALELLAEHKLNTSLLNAARAIVSLNPDQFRDAFQALELIKDNGSEISLVEAASLAIVQRKARMIGYFHHGFIHKVQGSSIGSAPLEPKSSTLWNAKSIPTQEHSTTSKIPKQENEPSPQKSPAHIS